MQALDQHLSKALKALRQEQGWSLERTAKETGVSKAMLGQIERGESSPTIATLWKIAGGFHTQISTFLNPPTVDMEDAVVRSTSLLRQQPTSDAMLVAPLFPYERRLGFEMLELTLLPGYERLSDPHEQGVTEHVVVLRGKMELLLDDQWITLTPGSGVRFAADQPHGYRNSTDARAVFYNLIHYDQARPVQ